VLSEHPEAAQPLVDLQPEHDFFIGIDSEGCAVLNDCKYGVSVQGNSINLTLLKSALAPDMTADRGTASVYLRFLCLAWLACRKRRSA
jgi:alpha-mannosidase